LIESVRKSHKFVAPVVVAGAVAVVVIVVVVVVVGHITMFNRKQHTFWSLDMVFAFANFGHGIA
jgi:hypothetical protein